MLFSAAITTSSLVALAHDLAVVRVGLARYLILLIDHYLVVFFEARRLAE